MKLKKFLARIWAFIAALWKQVDALVEKVAPIAINIVDQVKKINESTTGDIIEMIITAVIPGNADEKVIKAIREKLKEILPKVLLGLNMSEAIAQIEDPNEQLKAIILRINMSPDEQKNAYYHTLSVMILNAVSDGKLSWSESILIAEYYYINIHKPKS